MMKSYISSCIRMMLPALGALLLFCCSMPATAAASLPELAKGNKRILPRVQADSIRIRQIHNERVVVGSDTIGIILPERNLGRYDRGLYNFLFIPKGQWAFGLTAAYGSIDTKDLQLLNTITNLSFDGSQFSISPTVSYFISHNTSIGLKLSYNHGEASLGSLGVDIDEDLNFSLHDVGYTKQMYNLGIFYRKYVGLGTSKRFGIFNEVDLSFGSGYSRFQRYYSDELRDTRTDITKVSLNFSPGLCVFLMDNLSFNVSFGVFGLHLTNEKQRTNNVDEGSRFSSGANFRFNLFNINFGIGVHI